MNIFQDNLQLRDFRITCPTTISRVMASTTKLAVVVTLATAREAPAPSTSQTLKASTTLKTERSLQLAHTALSPPQTGGKLTSRITTI